MPRRTLWPALLLFVIAGACVPSGDALEFDSDTTMGEIKRAGKLVVGVEEAFRPFGFASGRGRSDATGFTVELAQLVGDAIGVEVEFVTESTGELLSMLETGEADLVFPATPITERLLRRHRVVDPYYIGHQRLLVSSGSDIDSVDDLAGRRVCSAVNLGTGLLLDDLVPAIRLVPKLHAEDCYEELESARVDAVTANEAFLLGIMWGYPSPLEIVGDDLTTEAFGAVARDDTIGFIDFVNAVFLKAKTDGRWQRLHEKWIAPLTFDDEDALYPPMMTAQQAGALFPLET